MRDLVIRGGTVVDGSGEAARHVGIAIEGERVVAVGGDIGAPEIVHVENDRFTEALPGRFLRRPR